MTSSQERTSSLRARAEALAMRAGSWFDRSDLTLIQRERAVAALILRELGRAVRGAA